MMNKRGEGMLDLLFMIVGLTVFIVAGLFMYKLFGGINSNIQADSNFDAGTKAQMQESYNRYPYWLDNSVLLFIGLTWIFLLIGAFFSDSHPVFFIVTLILIIAVLLVIMLLGQAQQDIINNPEFATETSNLPMTVWLFNHILEVCVGITLTMVVALYARK